MERLQHFLQEFFERYHMVAFVPFMFTKYREGRKDDDVIDVKKIIGWAVMVISSSLITAVLVTQMTLARLEEKVKSTNDLIVANQQNLIMLVSKNESRILRNEQRIDELVKEQRRR